jgi:hypothetical protein
MEHVKRSSLIPLYIWLVLFQSYNLLFMPVADPTSQLFIAICVLISVFLGHCLASRLSGLLKVLALLTWLIPNGLIVYASLLGDGIVPGIATIIFVAMNVAFGFWMKRTIRMVPSDAVA